MSLHQTLVSKQEIYQLIVTLERVTSISVEREEIYQLIVALERVTCINVEQEEIYQLIVALERVTSINFGQQEISADSSIRKCYFLLMLNRVILLHRYVQLSTC